MINSRVKGKVGELEVAALLRAHGFDARRGVQHKGGPDSPDVTVPDMPGIHLEVKRVEAGSLYNWMAQAERDSHDAEVPVVVHRRNHHTWVAILPFEDFIRLYKEANHG